MCGLPETKKVPCSRLAEKFAHLWPLRTIRQQ